MHGTPMLPAPAGTKCSPRARASPTRLFYTQTLRILTERTALERSSICRKRERYLEQHNEVPILEF